MSLHLDLSLMKYAWSQNDNIKNLDKLKKMNLYHIKINDKL